MIISKTAYQQGPPNTDITKFGWQLKEGVPSPKFASDSPASPGLIDVFSCGCKTMDKACSSTACSCQKAQLPCTVYCKCGAIDGCNNPYTITSEVSDNDSHCSEDELDNN
jgi:hypothetical protein